MLHSSKKELKHKLRKRRRRDEEMQQEESRKLNHQLTGFVEIKLAEGIKGDGVEMGSEHEGRGGPQTDNKHCIPKGKNWKMRMWQQFWYLVLTLHLFTLISQLQQHTSFTYTKHTLQVNTFKFVSAQTHYHTGAHGAPLLCRLSLSDMQDYSDLLWLSSRQLSSSRFL